MRKIIFTLCVLLCVSVSYAGVRDTLGVVRVFGDTKSWMTCAFVVGDGSFVVAPYKAITENVSDTLDNIHSVPIFISSYTGKAYKAKLVAFDKGLGVALLKIPVSGLPASPIAGLDIYKKAMYGSYGQLTQEELVGNKWGAEAFAVTTDTIDGVKQYTIGSWLSGNIFVTDMDKYQFAFISRLIPEKAVPNGALIAKDDSVIGMYLDKLTFTGGRVNYTYGRIAMSHELIKFLSKNGVDKLSISNPPEASASGMTGGGDAFAAQLSMYALIGQGKAKDALKCADWLLENGIKDALTYVAKGDGELDANNFDKALEAYNAASKLEDIPEAYIGRARVFVALEKNAEAENELKNGLAKHSYSSEIASELAGFYTADDNTLTDALTYAQAAQTLAPNSLSKRLAVARIYKMQKDYQAAINTIAEAIKISPDWTDGIFFLASTFEEAGDLNNAERGYALLIKKAPNNPTYLLVWASFLSDNNRKDEARNIIEKVRTLTPTGSAAEALKDLEKKINE